MIAAKPPNPVLRHAWRLLLRLRFALWQRRRHDRLVIERGLGIPLVVLPGVFNPSLFRTSDLVVAYLRETTFDAARALDIGTGTGILALTAARFCSSVVALDINPAAVRCTRINALLNRFEDTVDVRCSDLFEAVQGETFDLVLCNPPYYRGVPNKPGELAFYAGDFAERLAGGLPKSLHDGGQALVVLSSDGAEQEFLDAFAAAGLSIEAVLSRNLISERVTLYRLQADRG